MQQSPKIQNYLNSNTIEKFVTAEIFISDPNKLRLIEKIANLEKKVLQEKFKGSKKLKNWLRTISKFPNEETLLDISSDFEIYKTKQNILNQSFFELETIIQTYQDLISLFPEHPEIFQIRTSQEDINKYLKPEQFNKKETWAKRQFNYTYWIEEINEERSVIVNNKRIKISSELPANWNGDLEITEQISDFEYTGKPIINFRRLFNQYVHFSQEVFLPEEKDKIGWIKGYLIKEEFEGNFGLVFKDNKTNSVYRFRPNFLPTACNPRVRIQLAPEETQFVTYLGRAKSGEFKNQVLFDFISYHSSMESDREIILELFPKYIKSIPKDEKIILK